MISMEYCTPRLQCSDKDKLACIKTVEKLYNMAQVARKNGLLALEKMVENESDLYLQICTMMIVDATDPERASKLMENYIAAGNYYGKEFIEKMLIMDGVLRMQQGENPVYIVNSLGAWFGLEFHTIFQKEIQSFLPPSSPHPNITLKRSYDEAPSSPTAFDEFCYLDNRCMQRVIRELSPWDIAAALYGARENTVQHFLNNMSEHMKQEIIQEINEIQNFKEKAGMRAQAMIEDYAKALEEHGEIIFSKAMISFKESFDNSKNLTTGIFPEPEYK